MAEPNPKLQELLNQVLIAPGMHLSAEEKTRLKEIITDYSNPENKIALEEMIKTRLKEILTYLDKLNLDDAYKREHIFAVSQQISNLNNIIALQILATSDTNQALESAELCKTYIKYLPDTITTEQADKLFTMSYYLDPSYVNANAAETYYYQRGKDKNTKYSDINRLASMCSTKIEEYTPPEPEDQYDINQAIVLYFEDEDEIELNQQDFTIYKPQFIKFAQILLPKDVLDNQELNNIINNNQYEQQDTSNILDNFIKKKIQELCTSIQSTEDKDLENNIASFSKKLRTIKSAIKIKHILYQLSPDDTCYSWAREYAVFLNSFDKEAHANKIKAIYTHIQHKNKELDKERAGVFKEKREASLKLISHLETLLDDMKTNNETKAQNTNNGQEFSALFTQLEKNNANIFEKDVFWKNIMDAHNSLPLKKKKEACYKLT
jgi:hypothetical protein